MERNFNTALRPLLENVGKKKCETTNSMLCRRGYFTDSSGLRIDLLEEDSCTVIGVKKDVR